MRRSFRCLICVDYIGIFSTIISSPCQQQPEFPQT
jgi:hypothetical protein